MPESREQESRRRADSVVAHDAANAELLALIDAHVPLDLRADYLRMRAGDKIPKPRRERVLQAAREVLTDPAVHEAQRPSVTFEEPEDANDSGE